ncbi:MAG: hypothetical protein IT380_25385 [Myxococcales bacterium]|nr:hypothetical protein [Myxococcales bacterium]
MKTWSVGWVVVTLLLGCGRVEPEVGQNPVEAGLAPELPEAKASEVEARPLPHAAPKAPVSLATRPVEPSLQAGDFVDVEHVAAPDGARVRYMLGVVACGLFVVGQGEGVVQGGAFQAAFAPAALARWSGPVDLFLLFDEDGDQACTEADSVLQVVGVTPAPGGSIDASAAAPGYTGCWMFQQ